MDPTLISVGSSKNLTPFSFKFATVLFKSVTSIPIEYNPTLSILFCITSIKVSPSPLRRVIFALFYAKYCS